MPSLAEVFEDALPAAEWWAEWQANACCPNSSVAAARFCGCGGSGEVPSGISRLLTEGFDA
jgi:hypothetical protein